MSEREEELHLLKPLAVESRGENASALLHQLPELLRELLSSDQPSMLDLRAIPLSSWDHERLHEVLGEGGVSAAVASEEGVTIEVMQSAIPGIWWLDHLDEEGNLIGQYIEVSYCPEALITAVEDVADGLGLLRARLLTGDYLNR